MLQTKERKRAENKLVFHFKLQCRLLLRSQRRLFSSSIRSTLNKNKTVQDALNEAAVQNPAIVYAW